MCLSMHTERDTTLEYSECSTLKYTLCESNTTIVTHCETIIQELYPELTKTDVSKPSTVSSGRW